MRAIYSYNKVPGGFEDRYWQRELTIERDGDTIMPFNHGAILDVGRVLRAQLLDNLYYNCDPDLMRLYDHVRRLIRERRADCLIVDNALPYHPEFLRTLDVYKVERTSDGPLAAYDRDFAYVHGYDHVLHHSPAYSPDLTMAQKLAYVGARRTDFWPLALFDQMYDRGRSEDELFAQERDIDVIFVGALFPNKMPYLAQLKKAFGSRLMLRGLAGLKKNLYFKARHRAPGWVTPIAFEQYVPLYQRAKIGINVHNRGDYTVGGYRMFDLPGNGVMQICDGGPYLDDFFRVGEEVVRHSSVDDLIGKVRYYLDRPEERIAIARAGYRRTIRDHRIATRMGELIDLVKPHLGARSTSG